MALIPPPDASPAEHAAALREERSRHELRAHARAIGCAGVGLPKRQLAARLAALGVTVNDVPRAPQAPPPLRLPAAPILQRYASMPEMGGEGTLRYERLQRMLLRARETGHVTLYAADVLCIELLDLHPANVYGPDVWWSCDDDAGDLDAEAC